MLVFNPYFRPSVEECLEHPYLAKVRKTDQEVTAPGEISLKLEKEPCLNLERLRQLFLDEIDEYKELRL
jgi:hypothetical protein